MSKIISGAALAIAAAGLFGCAATSSTTESVASASTDTVQCFGVNKCAGHNECKSANNACAGQGKCKGQGFVMMSKSACDNVGGTSS